MSNFCSYDIQTGTRKKSYISFVGIVLKCPYFRITGEKLWFRDDPSESSKSAAKRKILPEKYRTMFSNKQVVCVEYSDLTDGDERDIFQVCLQPCSNTLMNILVASAIGHGPNLC